MVCFFPGDTNGEKRRHQGPHTVGLKDNTGGMPAEHVYERRRNRNSDPLPSKNDDFVGAKRKFSSDSITNSQYETRSSGQIKKSLLDVPEHGGYKQALDCNIMKKDFSLSKTNMEKSSPTREGGCVLGEHSFDILPTEPSVQLPSTRDLCTATLGNCDMLREGTPISDSMSFDVFGGNDASFQELCKLCGQKDSLVKLLVCDLCEEAFHTACVKVKALPVDDMWYCHLCLRKKPKVLPGSLSGQLFCIVTERSEMRSLKEKVGPIIATLQYTGPHETSTPVGKDCQAEVPEWSGPISDDDNYFSEPLELVPSDWYNFEDPIFSDSDEDDDGVIPERRRRAPPPLSMLCHCGIPCCKYRAESGDRAPPGAVSQASLREENDVPQEPMTIQELERHEYVKKLRPRLTKQGKKKK